MENIITSRQNNLVKFVRGLREKRNREDEGLFIIEGTKMIDEAMRSGVSLEKVIISQRARKLQQTQDIIAKVVSGVQYITVTEELLDYISDTETPQGIIALAKIPSVNLSSIKNTQEMVLVIIDGIQDPGNAGTIIRTADAFGTTAVILTRGSVDLYNSKTIRASMGSVFHLPVIRDVENKELLSFVREGGILLTAAALAEDAVSLHEAGLVTPLALIFGSEARGVSPELIEAADKVLKIPMEGLAESLNVSVAAGIALYETFRSMVPLPIETCK